ncbi:MAG: aminotransferase class I/II-fold pyridoxal phosphate-dependent enzyme [Muribaculaceae bacterium]|nr:aminotransferase class I/II-fold pyridoxal phosphate-dependent enzyme [Muribaculaceae bacterium]
MQPETKPSIRPADRVSDVKEYYFSTKLREIVRMKADGADVISLGIGGPDRPPHRSVISTLAEEAVKPDTHSYQPYVGLPQLRQAFASWYSRFYGVSLDPDTEIQPLIGSKEGILHISLAFLHPGDAVLVPDPGYPTYTSVSNLVGAKIYKYDLTPENGWYPDFDLIERTVPLDRVKIMWLNYPHMPTGTPATLDIFRKAVDFGRHHGILIAHDNPYSFILNREPLSILQIPGAKDVAIEMNSLSKSHNMAGWRIAMLASNPQFVQWVLRVKSNVDSGQFRPMMEAAVNALSLGSDWYDSLNDTYARRRVIAEKIMDALGCTFDPAQRGLFLWGRVPDSEKSGQALADRLLADRHIFITPGFIFGSQGDRYVRISLCATEQRLSEALDRING